MESFDIFVYVHGFHCGRKFIPVKFRFTEIAGNESVSLLVVNFEKGFLRRDWNYGAFTGEYRWKYKRLYRYFHGISKSGLRKPDKRRRLHNDKKSSGTKHFQSIDLEFLREYFKLHFVHQNLKLGCRGKYQKKLLMDITGGFVNIVDVEEYLPKTLLTPDKDALFLRRYFPHRRKLEANYAARISSTYAKIIGRRFRDAEMLMEYFVKMLNRYDEENRKRLTDKNADTTTTTTAAATTATTTTNTTDSTRNPPEYSNEWWPPQQYLCIDPCWNDFFNKPRKPFLSSKFFSG